jgi:hypothetical protein
MRRLLILAMVLVAGCASQPAAAASLPPSPTVTPSPTPSPTPKLGLYFYDMTAELQMGWPYDTNGIMVTPERQYNTVTIEQDALAYFALWQTTGSWSNRTTFLHYADWLLANQSPNGLWLYNYEFWTMAVPWHSAMAEGQGMSVLVRAWQATGEQRYLTAATAAMRTFEKPYAQDGVASYEGADTFYEEYDPTVKPHVLNGFIFALVGLYEYHAVQGDAESGRLFDAGTATLARDLPRWDSGSGTYYSLALPLQPAVGLYPAIHVAELQEMWLLTGNATFRTYAARWAGYLAPPASS